MIKVRVIIKRPGEKPYCTNVSTGTENLKRIVEGELRHVAIASNIGLIVNRDGEKLGLEPCFSMMGIPFRGTCVLIGNSGETWTDLPCTWREAKHLFPEIWGVEA